MQPIISVIMQFYIKCVFLFHILHTCLSLSLCLHLLFQFPSVREPVRRNSRPVSLTDPNVTVGGFQLLPSSVDFGMLQEGTTAAITVRMTNVGVNTCR